uniref:Uncharacterized protein n=1 Tax=Candida bohioensis TaxID=561986 RepID=U3MG03_9ASCO|nr:hypothetical protein [Candida bohioensis]YP_008578703.1 hypothetical protein [Candida bohioensis]AGW07356.1 hypothetical protein [Candida bohioensis]AGW07357.1 hypothetical protein [Candida bohioensis]
MEYFSTNLNNFSAFGHFYIYFTNIIIFVRYTTTYMFLWPAACSSRSIFILSYMFVYMLYLLDNLFFMMTCDRTTAAAGRYLFYIYFVNILTLFDIFEFMTSCDQTTAAAGPYLFMSLWFQMNNFWQMSCTQDIIVTGCLQQPVDVYLYTYISE